MITAVQPAARAAPSFRVIIADGKFQGVRIDLSRKVSKSADPFMPKARTQHLKETMSANALERLKLTNQQVA